MPSPGVRSWLYRKLEVYHSLQAQSYSLSRQDGSAEQDVGTMIDQNHLNTPTPHKTCLSITSNRNLDTQVCLPCTHLYAYIGIIYNQQVNYIIMGTIHIITVKYTDTVLQRGEH